MGKRAIIWFLLFSSLFIGNLVQVHAEKPDEYVILFDESHGQYFNSTRMETALNYLSAHDNVNVTILTQNNRFNSTNLQGIDLLIITNPGSYDSFNLSSSEVESILDFVELGGSLFLLTNPLSYDSNITGNPRTFNNDLLRARNNFLTPAYFDEKNGFPSVIANDFIPPLQNESYLLLNNFEGNSHEIFNEASINEVFLYSSPISMNGEPDSSSIGVVPKSSYSIYQDNTYNFPFDSLTWFLAKELGEARLVLSGSSIMFSDLDSIFNNTKCIETANNKQLWKNTIFWLLGIDLLEEEVIIVIPTFQYLAFSVIGTSIVVLILSLLLYKFKLEKTKPIDLK